MSSVLAPNFIFNISFEFRDLFQPDFRRRTNDDLRERVLSFEYEEEENKINKLTIKFDNTDLKLFDLEFLNVGSAIVFDFGYSSAGTFVKRFGRRRHFIVELTGNEVLTMVAYGGDFYAMNQQALTRTFVGLKGTEVVEQIADEYGFARKIIRADALGRRTAEARTTFQQVQQLQLRSFVFDQGGSLLVEGVFYQKSETDWQFLKRLAERDGFRFYVQDEIFVFVPFNDNERDEIRAFGGRPEDDLPKLTYAKENNETDIGLIKSFKLDHNILGDPGEVQAKGINSLTKQEFNSLSSIEQTERIIAGSESTLVNRDSIDLQKSKPNRIIPRSVFPIAGTAVEAQSTTNARLTTQESKALMLQAQVIGHPGARTNAFVRIEGLGSRYSGVWHCFKVKHKFDLTGYVTTMEFDKSGLEGPVIPRKARILRGPTAEQRARDFTSDKLRFDGVGGL